MYPCHSGDSFSVNEVDETKNIAGNVRSIDADHPPHKILCSSNDFLKLYDSNDLNQNNNYGQELLACDVFKLNKLCECDLGILVCSHNDNTARTFNAVKSPVTNEELSNKKHNSHSENTESCVIPKEIKLKSYRRIFLYRKEFNASVYKNAIKNITIDSNEAFKNTVLDKMGTDFLKNKRTALVKSKSSIELSQTYSNVRKYVLEKLYSVLSDLIPTSDIPITPGMSISDLRHSCLSNKNFFDKLSSECEKIAEDVRSTPYASLSHVFQHSISFDSNNCTNSTNNKVSFFPLKNKFLPGLKKLIIDTTSSLSSNIISEIEKSDQNGIVDGLFLKTHGVLIQKSSIRTINCFFDYNNKVLANYDFDDNLSLLKHLLEKLKNIVKASCAFHENKVVSLGESTIEQLSIYILTDMYNIPVKFHRKLKLTPQNIIERQRLSENFYLNYSRVANHIPYTDDGMELQLSKLDPTSRTKISTEINSNYDPSKLVIEYTNLEQCVSSPKINLIKYSKSDLFLDKLSSSIYENAINKVDIDINRMFRNSILEKLDAHIKRKGFAKSSVDLSLTYSNVRKYILCKLSLHIKDIIKTADVPITLGMSISDIRSRCLSNKLFFDKLAKSCDKALEEVPAISEKILLSMIQSNVIFDSDERLNINHKKYKFLQELKLLITETISNLVNSIINVIKNLKPSEIINGLFYKTHGIFVSKSLIRELKLFFNSNKIPIGSIEYNLSSINNFLVELTILVKKHVIFHEGMLFFPEKHTAEALSRYLLSDMYNIPSRFYKKIKVSSENISKPHSSIEIASTDINCRKDITYHTFTNTESKLLEKPITFVQKKSSWNPALIRSINIYRLAISMINIDKGNFENSFIDKIKHIPLVKKYLYKQKKIEIGLHETYTRAKSYILETFHPFLTEIEKETKTKIVLHHGITLNDLKNSYISNEEFFKKLRIFCSNAVERLKNFTDNSPINLIQEYICLGTETQKKMIIRKNIKLNLLKDITRLLIINISSIPDVIINSIKLIPCSKLAGGHLSPFHDMYVDNISLLKVKLAFDAAISKVINDPLLSWLVDKVSLEMIGNSCDGNNIKSKNQYKFINSYITSKGLYTYSYIKKLAKNELVALRNNIGDTIMIMNNDKIENTDKVTRSEILNKLESDLIAASIKAYKNSCIKAYKSKLGTKH
ncbi:MULTISPECIES: hypothetical protein [Candidatus Ichthyocystis]|uniref:Uncharacterized protein n=1 Tax=Candidatus Ichthyocystis hellenicum TaxID=1561003 RepID=A0A0S4M6B4_9BURK|nr:MULTISPECIES: hypothetical protein [Ichthyocystis]CUT18266.1 hypothetical protein Ark11_1468 [Candidatus Ichthyocystis hellenicum]